MPDGIKAPKSAAPAPTPAQPAAPVATPAPAPASTPAPAAKHEPVDRDFRDFQSPHEASVDRLIDAVDRAYHRPYLMMWRSFLQGLMSAIGAAVGWTIFISVTAYVFQALGGFDILKPSIEKLQEVIIPAQIRNQLEATPTPTPTATPIQTPVGSAIIPQ